WWCRARATASRTSRSTLSHSRGHTSCVTRSTRMSSRPRNRCRCSPASQSRETGAVMALNRFSFPTAITFGPGARREVAAHLKQHGVKYPLIVTDKGLAELPILKDFVASLIGLPVKVYSGVFGNPVKQQVIDGVKAFQDHKADAVIGFGGGAALDVAKAVALMAVHEGD